MTDADFEMMQDTFEPLVRMISNALKEISYGDLSPKGLEGVAIALAGYELKQPIGMQLENVGRSIRMVAEANNNIADALNNIAEAIKQK